MAVGGGGGGSAYVRTARGLCQLPVTVFTLYIAVDLKRVSGERRGCHNLMFPSGQKVVSVEANCGEGQKKKKKNILKNEIE